MMIRRILAAVILLIFAACMPPVYGQDDEQTAIDTVVNHPVFAAGLANIEGWTVAAYDSNNRYGIWRVQFWDANGAELAWANVNPVRGKVYSYDAFFAASPAQIEVAEPVLRAYINSHPDVLSLIEDPGQYPFNIRYDPRARLWRISINIGDDSVNVHVRFAGETADSLENPQLIGIHFPNLLSYADWQEASQAEAVAVAFQNGEISQVLGSAEAWITQTEHLEGVLWRVRFLEGERLLAEATVDLGTKTLVEYTIR